MHSGAANEEAGIGAALLIFLPRNERSKRESLDASLCSCLCLLTVHAFRDHNTNLYGEVSHGLRFGGLSACSLSKQHGGATAGCAVRKRGRHFGKSVGAYS